LGEAGPVLRPANRGEHAVAGAVEAQRRRATDPRRGAGDEKRLHAADHTVGRERPQFESGGRRCMAWWSFGWRSCLKLLTAWAYSEGHWASRERGSRPRAPTWRNARRLDPAAS